MIGMRAGNYVGGVGQVGAGFCECAKVRRTVFPSHGDAQGDANEWIMGAHLLRQYYGQLEGRGVAEWDAIVSICEVNFGHEGWPEGGIAVGDALKNALQGVPKLHGLCGCYV
jgi:hypothetical protein